MIHFIRLVPARTISQVALVATLAAVPFVSSPPPPPPLTVAATRPTSAALAAPKKTPAPIVDITTAGRLVTSGSVSVDILWCLPWGGDPWGTSDERLELAGVDITSSASWSTLSSGQDGNCDWYEVRRATITMAASPQVQQVHAYVFDSNNYLGEDYADFAVPAAGRSVLVAPEAGFARPTPSSSGNTATFTIWNTGDVNTTYSLSAGCSGAATPSTCSLSPSSVAVNAGSSGTATVTYTASGTPGNQAWITLTATDNADYTNVAVGTGSAGVEVTSAPSAGVTIARNMSTTPHSACVAASIGSDAAMECGALRITHALPAVTTLGTPRVPTLIYNSQTARPMPVVHADITTPCSLPSSVDVKVYVGGVQRGNVAFSGSDWGSCGTTRRVAIPVDASAYATSLNDYYVYVTYSGGAGGTATSSTEKLAIVDRSGSPFGAGWWLAGLEEIHVVSGSTILWVGGDGSTKVYTGGSGTFVAASFDRPDTITYNGGTGEYTRQGPGNVDIKFNSSGYHVSTTNRLGFVTSFAYNSGTQQLSSITIPVRSGSALTYSLSYTSNVLSSVTAPGSRTVSTSRSGAKVTGITDPDGQSVSFGYAAGSNANRIDSRTDRRGYTTTFSYDANNGLSQSSIPTGGTAIVTGLRPVESYASSSALPLDSMYTSIDGPRSDVTDVTKIWVGPYGAPIRIRNAEGRETALTYDGTFPGLVSETRSPSQLRTVASYNSTGTVSSTTTYSPYGGSDATTTYTYDSSWPLFVKTVVGPTGVADTMTYNSTTGNRTSAQHGGSSRQVTFTYTSDGLDSTVTEPGSRYTYIAHNALGNVSSVKSPRGYVSFTYQNSFGQDTMIATPGGDTTGAASFNASYYTQVKHWYNAVGQDSVSTTYGAAVRSATPSSNDPGSDSLRVEHTYDAEGNPTYVYRKFRASSSNWTLTDSWTYDQAGRVTASATPSSSKSFTLDPAGNVTAVTNGRSKTVTTIYDALNRVSKRITPSVTYSSTSCTSFFTSVSVWTSGCNFSFPTIGSSVCIDADTAKFQYDAAGNMIRADNRYARVRRSYYKTGQVQDDTLRIRTVLEPGDTPCASASGEPYFGGDEWTLHRYTMQHSYNLAGQQTGLVNPYNLTGCTTHCTTSWSYSTATGELSSVTDDLAGTMSFAYDANGRVTSTAFPGSWKDSSTYDLDGNVATRLAGSGTGIDDALRHDAQGRVIYAALGRRDGQTYGSTVNTWYGPMGAVIAADGVARSQGGTTTEEFTVDAIGNRLTRRAVNIRPTSHPDVDGTRVFGINSLGQLYDETAPTNSTGYYHDVARAYDGSGNLAETATHEQDGSSNALFDVSLYYYDAGDKLRITNRAIGPHADDETHPGQRNVFEEYMYDALGRRVITRSRHAWSCSTTVRDCNPAVERTVWDGDNVLMEFRSPGGSGMSQYDPENDAAVGNSGNQYPYGRVTYVHAGGIDQPLAVIRMGLQSITDPYVVFPHTNWRGQFEVGSKPNGGVCPTSCLAIDWPGAQTNLDGDNPTPADGAAWFGSLITGQRDGSGMTYLRNRYYDPSSGRFTQEDPIGLAGGTNAYGFAGGDRVNFNDPFGLTPCCIQLAGVTEGMRRAASEGLKNLLLARMEEMALNMPITGLTSVGESLLGMEGRAIQRFADKHGVDVTVVGSRASGTANAASDWDYVIGGNAKIRSAARRELPRGASGGEIGPSGRGTGIDVINGNEVPVDKSKPHVPFKPKGGG